jgi:REP element-mobilizing transposase RayT
MNDRVRRKRMRLEHHDYAMPGAYFVTACTIGRRCLFGEVVDGAMLLNDFGREVEAAWKDLPQHFGRLTLDHFVVMPNHVHGILVLGDGSSPLSEVVRSFKTFSAHRVNLRRGSRGASLWQRGFYDHVVRDEADLARIREYIENNPARWALDEENPERSVRQKP